METSTEPAAEIRGRMKDVIQYTKGIDRKAIKLVDL